MWCVKTKGEGGLQAPPRTALKKNVSAQPGGPASHWSSRHDSLGAWPRGLVLGACAAAWSAFTELHSADLSSHASMLVPATIADGHRQRGRMSSVDCLIYHLIHRMLEPGKGKPCGIPELMRDCPELGDFSAVQQGGSHCSVSKLLYPGSRSIKVGPWVWTLKPGQLLSPPASASNLIA